ncbi:hypothetical protein JRO89_XS02G0066300 [Xanthoceras sorbifolium]|uniref:DUF659 domain-containing protein n=1 Tax=Xanthoceras sorbifolium TaxID=99658 RepID=A0ABQ8IFK8_9ROSI|nr:hypothetical protein JRO89_XS02G0066300 [Xanthoceras sorbifolium]
MSDYAANASSNRSDSQLNVRDQALLWQYVTKIEKMGTGGKNISFQCNFYHQVYRGSYSRVKCYLLKTKEGGIASCSIVTSVILLELNQAVEEAELRVKQSLPRQVLLPSTMASGSSSKTCSTGASGLSFHFVRNPYYVRVFTKAYNNLIAGYVPPGYNALRTTILQKEKTSIDRMLGPIKDSWKDKSISVCSDGCPQNVVQVIADNAAACKAAGLLVEAKFQHIFWTPCVVHTLNLALKNIFSPSSHPSERWDLYKEDDTEKARAVKEKILDEYFWIDMDYIINFTAPIYEMIQIDDTDTPCLHLVYAWWDSMIEKVKIVIFRKEWKQLNEESMFFDVVHGILVERWTKSSTPLHCLVHSLNPRYYHKQWLEECPGAKKDLRKFASFSGAIEDFASADSVEDRGFMSLMKWWLFHRASTQTLQSIALKLFRQPCDGFDSMNMENSGILEIADLSIDEPDLEDVLFSSTASDSVIVDE